jgi:hypothetical protein
MNDYLILFREPDGRQEPHPTDAIEQHQKNWNEWLSDMKSKNKLTGGKPLTLEGTVMRPTPKGLDINDGAYTVHNSEIVGGYLLIRAENMQEATELMKTCPVFEFDGFAEIREVINV